MKNRFVFPITLMLVGFLAGVSCAAPGVVTSPPSPLPFATSTDTIAPGASSTPVTSPSPLRSPTQVSSSTLNDLKYYLIAQFGQPFNCDPDAYPVARMIPDDVIIQRVAELKKNLPEYQAILRHLGIAATTDLSIEQAKTVYAESNKLNAIALKSVGDTNEFSLRVGTGKQGEALSGVINSSGVVTLTKREPAVLTCPICLAVDTLIDAPQGKIPVQDIQPGILVWTVDAAGQRRATPVLAVNRQPVTADFQIARVVLNDGRAILASPNHPTMDGRMIGDLSAGDFIDGARVVNAARELYTHGWTYDLLPAGDTGAYWANGILLKSTLAK